VFIPLDSIGFYNLKAFGDWQTLPIRRLNLIFGKNSSGKSSIFHSLLWIRDVLLNKNLNIMTPERSEDFIDLGGLEQFVHFKKKKETRIGFRLTVAIPMEHLQSASGIMSLRFEDISGHQSQDHATASILRAEGLSKLFHSLSEDKKSLTASLEISFDLKNIFKRQDNRFRSINVQPSVSMSLGSTEVIKFDPAPDVPQKQNPYPSSSRAGNYGVTINKRIIELLEPVVRPVLKLHGLSKPKAEITTAGDLKEIEKNLAITLALIGLLEEGKGLGAFPNERELPWPIPEDSMYLLHKSEYHDLSFHPKFSRQPVRNQTIAFYSMEYGILVERIGTLIWRAAQGFFIEPNYLAAYRNYPEREISQRGLLKLRQQDPYGNESYRDIFENQEFLQRINKACETLDADFKFVLDKQSNRSTGLRLEIKNRHSGLSLSFRDIGFGWSQVLPVIVEIVQGLHTALFVEQPELHLHPANQSQLMDVVLNNLGTHDQIAPPVFLELHSEQMILRLLRRIKESGSGAGRNKIMPEDCSILYVKREKDGSVISKLRVSEDGSMLDPWPGGFFESALKDF